MADQVKYVLDEEHIPKSWYNIQADLPEPLSPVLHPGTGEPAARPILSPLFRWTLSFRRFLKSATLRSPNRFETSIVAGALAHCTAPEH